MKRTNWKQLIQRILYAFLMLLGLLGPVSCKKEYEYVDKSPDWLGASIYDYLETDGHYTYFVRLIDDVGYTEVLKKTGSKTLFVAPDSAFVTFFQSNPWGTKNYSELTLGQKKLILNYSMINNAYLIETLSNYNIDGDNGGTLMVGQAMRHATAISVLDSIPFEKGDALPNGAFWNSHKTKGLYLLKDDTSWPLVHFLQKQLDFASISNDDFQIITGVSRVVNDAHIFGCKIVSRDIVCKNGYIDVLAKVLIPPYNMADYVVKNSDLSTFSGLLNRFCAPYYSATQTLAYKKLHPDFNDSIFVKRFYTLNSGGIPIAGGTAYYPNLIVPIKNELLLPFDPGWNSYNYRSSSLSKPLQADMAAMFVPSNAAMDAYFNNGIGQILKERYQTWDNVPDAIIALLLRRHMVPSFVSAVPSRFEKLMDQDNFPIPAKKTDVVGSYIGNNGLVYLINTVYSPPDYESVYAPVLFSEKTKVFNWAVLQNQFKLYLNSLESKYSFFVPTDEYLKKYIDPVTIAKSIPAALKFWYNNNTNTVNATVYKYNITTNSIGDSVGVVTDKDFISNRLLDLLDNHVVVGNVESGNGYYFTKGGNIIKVSGNGMNLTVQGGGDITLGQQSNVVNLYPQTNGNTYLIDKPIQTPLKSTYSILSTTPEFSEFFALMNGFPSNSSSVIFLKKKNYYGIDYNIKFFNTFNYTVYVPTNAAIQDAISQGIIIPWDSRNGITGINDMTDITQQNAAILKLERFLRYHFQDNSVLVSGNPVSEVYATATIKNDTLSTYFNTYQNKYYKLGITGAGSNLSLTTETGSTANVVTQNGLYNIIVRDYIFSADPLSFKEIDGSGAPSATDYSKSEIFTSSTAVIHQIDHVLQFQ